MSYLFVYACLSLIMNTRSKKISAPSLRARCAAVSNNHGLYRRISINLAGSTDGVFQGSALLNTFVEEKSCIRDYWALEHRLRLVPTLSTDCWVNWGREPLSLTVNTDWLLQYLFQLHLFWVSQCRNDTYKVFDYLTESRKLIITNWIQSIFSDRLHKWDTEKIFLRDI